MTLLEEVSKDKGTFLQRVRWQIGRIAVLLRFSFPFQPVNPNTYMQLAAAPFFNKLLPEQLAEFGDDVDRYLTDTRLPETNFTILEAMRSFVFNDDLSETMLDPENNETVLFVQRRKMVEVLFREDGVYFAFFETIGGNPRKMFYHHRVHNWRDGFNRRLRYIENATGELKRPLGFDKSFIFDPREPLVVFKPDLPDDHPLMKWVPTKPSEHFND